MQRVYASIVLLAVTLSLLPGKAISQSNNPTDPDAKTTIYVQSLLGPFGSAYIPAELVSNAELKEIKSATDGYYFPSIYFVISIKPGLKVKQKNGKPDIGKSNSKVDLIQFTFELEGFDKNKNKVTDGIKILRLLPDETKVIEQLSPAAEAAKTVSNLTETLTPFFPDPTQGNMAKAAAKGMGVVFNGLFPPQLNAYKYAFILEQGKFGWYLEHSVEGKESGIGMRRGIVLLQVRKDVVNINIKSRATYDFDHDKWIDDGKMKFPDANIQVEKILDALIKAQEIDFDHIKDLNDFPILIPVDVAAAICHMEDQAFKDWFKSLKVSDLGIIEGVDSEGKVKSYVRKSDLEKILLPKK